MGCFGKGGSCSSFGCEWLIILAIFFFIFCCDDNSCLSGIFDDCDWLVWLAIILLVLFLAGDNDKCCD